MKLSLAISKYVSYQQSLGMQFLAGEKCLKRLLKNMGDIHLDQIDSDAVWAHLAGQAPIKTHGVNQLSTLRGFYRFLLARGYVSSSPLPKSVQRPTSAFKPHIFSREELGRLFAATDELAKRWDPLRAPTFRALFTLLYGAGLRISEALRLTMADVDLTEDLLTVHKSKFYKSRLVPIPPDLTAVLDNYFRKRKRYHRPVTDTSIFFVTCKKASLDPDYARKIYQEVRRRAGLDKPSPGGSRPRLHDLRHTSAVHRLISWYRDGKDIHALLPYLCTYLGHLNLSGTKHYLTMIPELLEAANDRFERYACLEVSHE
jgi:site-specific recombinase XerD